MTFSINILDNLKLKPNGFPVVITINNKVKGGKNKPKQYQIGYSLPEHFDKGAGIINSRHPDYEIFAPKILNYKIKAGKMLYQDYTDSQKFLDDLLAANIETVKFTDAASEIVADMVNMAGLYAKNNDQKASDKIKGNIKVYENALAQFEIFSNNLNLVDLEYNLLFRFKNYQLGIGNSPNTVHQYLRTIRAIYNKAALKYKIPAATPFKGVFVGLSQKSYSSKKKNISKESVVLLENAEVTPGQRKYLDMWLLQFYFGGCDLIDIYYLYKKNLRRGRVYFERNKTNSGLPIDLKVHPKAKKIIDRYTIDNSVWLFPFEKDKELYESFRSAYGKALKAIQQQLDIEVLPTGGNIAVKVARHTFATIGKNLLIHEDVLRELMGHERNEVDNYYKDKFPESVRDEALFKIIE